MYLARIGESILIKNMKMV